MNTIYIFERGILGWETLFGDWKQWPNEAVAWIHKNTPHKAQTLTYFCGPVLAAATRTFRAKQFAKLILKYKCDGWRIVMVCHSEGTATALRALRVADWPVVDELHLVCGACDSDFNNNGLNVAMLKDRVKNVMCYVAGKDVPMKIEDTYVGSLCFGLQTAGTPLGLKGPVSVADAVKSRVGVIHWPAYGHSDCFLPKNFEDTMRLITCRG